MKMPPPLVRTPMASQVALPVKTEPKSERDGEQPLVTPTSRLVNVTPICRPVVVCWC